MYILRFMLWLNPHKERSRLLRLPVDFYRPWHESSKTVTFGGDRPRVYILSSLRPYVPVEIRLYLRVLNTFLTIYTAEVFNLLFDKITAFFLPGNKGNFGRCIRERKNIRLRTHIKLNIDLLYPILQNPITMHIIINFRFSSLFVQCKLYEKVWLWNKYIVFSDDGFSN